MPNLRLENSQSLCLTSELRQGIEMLGMSAAELAEFVRGAIEENPFLEYDERQFRKHPCELGGYSCNQSAEALLSKLQPRFSGGGGRYGEIKEVFEFERFMVDASSPYESLEVQLELLLDDHADRSIGHYLIGNLDRSGYLCISVEEAAQRLGAPLARIEHVLGALQSCQPIGIAARDLKECLLLQLEARGPVSLLVRHMVLDHLEDLAIGNLSKVAKRFEVSLARVQESLDLIRTLDPRPGLSLDCSVGSDIWPEVVVERAENGYRVRLRDIDVPRVAISQTYLNLAGVQNLDAKTARYLRDRREEAVRLMDGIDRRKQTLLDVSQSIVAFQSDFLDRGLEYLKPLTMAEIARAVGVHESTVSRVVNGNYMQTPRGLFELRSFFHSSVGDERSAGAVSSESVKHAIKRLIGQEDSHNPLSDTQLQAALSDEGIAVSRRTVNKYRTSLGIPSHKQRVRYCV